MVPFEFLHKPGDSQENSPYTHTLICYVLYLMYPRQLHNQKKRDKKSPLHYHKLQPTGFRQLSALGINILIVPVAPLHQTQ